MAKSSNLIPCVDHLISVTVPVWTITCYHANISSSHTHLSSPDPVKAESMQDALLKSRERMQRLHDEREAELQRKQAEVSITLLEG